jgi:molecular chaperone HscB
MPADFLMQQMAWREALDDAARWPSAAGAGGRTGGAQAQVLAALAEAGRRHDLDAAAAQQVSALMFIERFRDDIERQA